MKDIKETLAKFENCLEREIPYCTGSCPFGMDILDFMEKTGRSASKAAFKTYRNAVGFPRIANMICDEPCKAVCPRINYGGAIEMRLLEKAAIVNAKDTNATDYNIPPKKEHVAIIGAGISGMAALLRLSTKKYHVEVFEKTDRVGGSLKDAMDPEIYNKDFNEQLEHQEYKLHFNTEIASLDFLRDKDFDAVYIATGKNGKDFGLLEAANTRGEKFCAEIEGMGVFAGGEVIGSSLLHALADGLNIGTVIDNYLKTKSLYYPRGQKPSAMCAGMVSIKESTPPVQAAAQVYTKDEASSEASRCIRCQCSACYENCDLIEFTKKWPVRMRDEITATTLEGKTEIKATPARRLMSLCNQCGLCREVCPEDINLDELFMIGRQKMYKQGKMPWVFHDYYVRDMKQANEEAALIRKPINMATGAEYETSEYAFFPGCQLGAAEPEIIVKVYDSLLQQKPDTAIFLQCCGIAADWEGNENGFNEILEDIKTKWKSLGKPTMILACMNCYKKFKDNLPEIPITTIYEILVNWEISGGCNSVDYSIFNPCTARNEKGVREAVKALAEDMGVTLHPLKENEEYAKCCGYGGHGDIANPAYADYVADKRINETEFPLITYCINCRDMFKTHGKDAVHILELIYGMGDSNMHMIHEHDHENEGAAHDNPAKTAEKALAETLQGAPEECDGNCSACMLECGTSERKTSSKLPTITERQRNRMELKQGMLQLFWNETMEIEDNMLGLTLHMSDKIKDKLNKKKIFEQEVAQVVDFCQRTGRTIINTETGTLTGYSVIGHATYWVEYKVIDKKKKIFEIVNAYTHRLKIELEAVWNGEKREDEM